MQRLIHAASDEKSPTRRSFLQRLAGLGLVTTAGVTLLPRPSWARFRYVPFYAPIEDVHTLNYLLLLERLSAAFYTANSGKPFLGHGLGVTTIQDMVDEIRDHETGHVAILEQSLGAKADPAPTFQGLEASTLDQFLTMAQTLADTGVSAYVDSLPSINDKQALAVASGISAVKARDAGGLRAYRKTASTAAGGDPNTTLTEDGGAVNHVRTRDQVLAAVAPFIAGGAA